MRRILIVSLPVLMIALWLGCSKDHEAPTFASFKNVLKPENVVATYDPTSDAVHLTWDMNKMNDVIDFFVTVSDSMNLKSVNKLVTATGSIEKNYTFPVNEFLPDTQKKVVLYFTVSALYNSETLRYFIGPNADEPDSALIVRK